MTTTPLHPGIQVQLAVHRAVRRDIARLTEAVTQDGRVPPSAIRSYWNETDNQLHEHHVLEDTVVWPLMRARLGERVATLLDRNVQEHLDMAAAMDDFSAVVATTTSDYAAARAVLRHLEQTVETHLGHEEADVLPLIPEAFTVEDVLYFAAEAAKTNAPNAFLPWLLDDAADDDAAFLTASIPPPIRSELESRWMPQWQAKVDGLAPSQSLPTS